MKQLYLKLDCYISNFLVKFLWFIVDFKIWPRSDKKRQARYGVKHGPGVLGLARHIEIINREFIIKFPTSTSSLYTY